jgi:hypothetical protein
MSLDLGFMSDEDKLKHFAKFSNINLDDYPYATTLKVYEGSEFLVYGFTQDEELKLYTSFIVTDMCATSSGFDITLLDKQDYTIFKVGDIPTSMKGYNLVGHIPYRCSVERSVKVTPRGKTILGLTCGMVCRLRSSPLEELPGHAYIIPQHKVLQYFTEEELALAEENLRGQISE